MIKHLFGICFILGLLICLSSCDDEEAAGPGDTDTFIKLFGSENQETARDIIIESTGNMLLLSTQEIEDDNQQLSQKIKVRYVDNLGNQLWEQTYPEEDFEDTGINYLASEVITHSSGYLIVGESINEDNQKRLLILNIDPSGNELSSTEFSINEGDVNISGVGISINSANEIKVTASVESDGNEFWVGTFNDNLENLEDCNSFYPAALSNPAMLRSTFITASDEIVFCMSGLQPSGRINSRLAKVPNCQSGLLSSPFISTSGNSNFNASFITPTLFGFAIVGTTNQNANPDLFLARVNDNGEMLDESAIVFGTDNSGVDFDREEEGLSVVQTNDGGLLIGGSSESNEEGGSDIVLVKTDFSGNVEWVQFYGDRNDEEANVVAQSEGNGFVVLGTTEFGGINSLILIKTDRLGNIR